jgi:hypothetical protein
MANAYNGIPTRTADGSDCPGADHVDLSFIQQKGANSLKRYEIKSVATNITVTGAHHIEDACCVLCGDRPLVEYEHLCVIKIGRRLGQTPVQTPVFMCVWDRCPEHEVILLALLDHFSHT